jgi:N-succinyldiaminopimelate aminotransferase
METSVFERMSQAAAKHGAVNLGQGFPDFGWPPEILEAAARAVVEGSNQYAPSRGLPALREAVAAHYQRHQGLDLSAENICVTSGATEALAAAILASIQPGDEAVLLQPFYDAYLPLVERAGGTAKTVSLEPPHWTVPLDKLEAAIGRRTRMIVLNTPNNPAGTLVDRATLEAIRTLCERHDLVLLCDEVWEGMVFRDARHVSPLTLPGLGARAIKIGSAGKIFSLTGWKVGWAVAAPPLAEALALPAEWHRAHRARYAAARERLVSGLTTAGYVLLPADGTWFVTVDLAASGLPADDEAVADRMIREAGVAAIPVSAFYRDDPERGYLRLCFANEDATLDAAIERLGAFRRRE